MIRQLSILLRPWVNPKAIHNAPKAIVKDLLAQQRSLEERITGSSSRSFGEWLQPMLIVVVVVISASLFVTLLVGVTDMTSYSLENMSYSFMSHAYQVINENQLLVTAVLAWAVGTGILWSAFRH